MLPLKRISWLNSTIFPYRLTSWSTNCSQWLNCGIVSTADRCLVNTIVLSHQFNMDFGLQIKFPNLWSHQNVASMRSLIPCLLDGRNIVSLKTNVTQCQCSLWYWTLRNIIPNIFRSCHLPIFYHYSPSFQQICLSIFYGPWTQKSWQWTSQTQVIFSKV